MMTVRLERFLILREKVAVMARNRRYLETQPIVSVLVSRSTLEGMNREFIDPFDSMSKFVCNMAFTKANGFKPVERLMWEPVPV